MNDTSDRIECPKCHANNFTSSAVCWQCGEPLPRQEASTPPPSAQPGPTGPQPRYSEPPRTDNSQTLVILGFVFAGLGLLCCPIFALAGLIIGIVVQRRGKPIGTWIIVVSAVVLVASVLITIFYTAKFLTMYKQNPTPWMTPGQPNPFSPPR